MGARGLDVPVERLHGLVFDQRARAGRNEDLVGRQVSEFDEIAVVEAITGPLFEIEGETGAKVVS